MILENGAALSDLKSEMVRNWLPALSKLRLNFFAFVGNLKSRIPKITWNCVEKFPAHEPGSAGENSGDDF